MKLLALGSSNKNQMGGLINYLFTLPYLLQISTIPLVIHGHGSHSDHDHIRSKPFDGDKVVIANRQYQNFGAWTQSNEFARAGARCAQYQPSEGSQRRSSDVTRDWTSSHPCYGATGDSRSALCDDFREPAKKIQVHFHVIHSGDRGNMEQQKILHSMRVLSDAYYPHFDFVFDIEKDVYRKFNPDWYYMDTYDFRTQAQMKSSLRKGDCGDLNIYTLNPSGGILGWATFPDDCAGDMMDDGVVIHAESVPGGFATNYNYGHTLVHEVGHWLGLYHTFQNGCSDPGDYVMDTPQEASPAFGCPRGRDTCVGDAGLDPISNYMDYSYDSCMTEFTQEQYIRMMSHYDKYRNQNSKNEAPTPAPSSGKVVIETTPVPSFIPSIQTSIQGSETNETITSPPSETPTLTPSVISSSPSSEPTMTPDVCNWRTKKANCLRNNQGCCAWKQKKCSQRPRCNDCENITVRNKCMRNGCCFWKNMKCMNKDVCPRGYRFQG